MGFIAVLNACGFGKIPPVMGHMAWMAEGAMTGFKPPAFMR
jgi:hypothetical protein